MGNVNIALNKKATATNYIAPYVPARAVDGNTSVGGSRWLCRTPGAMIIDLGAPIKVDGWAIQDMSKLWGFGTAIDYSYSNNKVDLYLSADGKSWNLIDSIIKNDTSKSKIFTAVEVRYAKIGIDRGNGIASNNQMGSIVDFQLFAVDPTPNTLTGFVVTGNDGVVRPYTPIFASATQQYTSLVGADVASVTIKPTATDTKAIVKVNGIVVATGASSAAITLVPGTNTVTITVEPFVGTINTYTLTITKKVSSLTGLTVKYGNDMVPMKPAFDPFVKEYSGYVEFSDASFNVQSILVTPTADSNTKITCNGQTITSGTAITIANPVVGDNVLQITASALDGSNPTTYKVTVTRKHSTYLKTISSTPGEVTPSVTKTTSNYTIKGGRTAPSVSVNLIAEDNTSQIKVIVDGITTLGTLGTITFTTPVAPAVKNANVSVISLDNLSSKEYVLALSK